MLIETIPVGALQVNCYVLGCETTRQAIVIDPGDEAEAILAALDQHGLTLTRILATHAHFDHLLACRELQERTGAPFYLHPADRPLAATLRRTCMAWLGYDPGQPPDITGDLTPGETIQAGEHRARSAAHARPLAGQRHLRRSYRPPCVHRRCAFRRLDRPHRSARRRHAHAACQHPVPDPHSAR